MSAAPSTLRARALAAADALPPTFPIGTFVAANPLRGSEGLSFERAAAHAAATTGAESFLSEREYRELYSSGRIGEQDLRRALLRRWPDPDPPRRADDPDVELALASLLGAAIAEVPEQIVRTRAALHDEALAERIDATTARWCAAYLDRGQADWALPGRELGLFGAWHRLAPHDPGLRRLVGRSARRAAAQLPTDPASALASLVDRLRIDDGAVTEYFRASLRRLPGWGSAVARGDDPDDLVGLLAMRLALEHLALGPLAEDVEPWTAPAAPATLAPSFERRSIWQEALELAYRDRLLATLTEPAPQAETDAPEAQVVMCIDVRSEGMRRHLEQVGPYETLGFAGFFGLPVRVADLDHDPVASCPVIVEPRATVREVAEVDLATVRDRHDRHEAEEAAWDARHDAKSAPAAPFAFAEAAGWVLGPLAALRTFSPRAAAALSRGVQGRLVPELPTRMDVGPDQEVGSEPADGPGEDASHGVEGFSPQEQVRVAHSALTTMGLTSDFAPLVVFCGHRSATTNNPFAASLDCGACAGKAGGPNARALAELLNRRNVRDGLVEAGIRIPGSTWFVAAEHETTTDTVHLLDRHRVPTSHLERLEVLERDLADAGGRLAAERAAALPTTGGASATAHDVARRSADWAEPLPEWGLVRNAAVVVGPRSLSAGRDLERRVFLHSYDALADIDGTALGAILTGPLVVGHWISSQYYFSTVDPRRHGAGTKPLHNVVGGIGVHEGPGGDLRVGLPLESVQFAGARMHEPLRLLAVVHAPIERLEGLIGRNSAVAQLLDNGWIRLVAGGGAEGWQERLRGGRWVPCDEPSAGPVEPSDHRRGDDAGAGSMSSPVTAGSTATGRSTDGS